MFFLLRSTTAFRCKFYETLDRTGGQIMQLRYEYMEMKADGNYKTFSQTFCNQRWKAFESAHATSAENSALNINNSVKEKCSLLWERKFVAYFKVNVAEVADSNIAFRRLYETTLAVEKV